MPPPNKKEKQIYNHLKLEEFSPFKNSSGLFLVMPPGKHENQGLNKCTKCLAGLEGFDCCTFIDKPICGKHRRVFNISAE